MNMKVEFRGGARFDIVSGRHTLVTDQPVEDGGQDAGMSPVELFVGSLASCVGYFVGRYCARHKIACEGFTVDAEWSYAEQPHRVRGRVPVHQPAVQLTPEQRERLLKVAHGCTVHQSIAVPAAIRIDLQEGTGGHGAGES